MTMPTTLSDCPADNPELLRQLHIKPAISWPVVGILALALPIALYLIVAVTAGWIPPLLAAVPGALVGYYLFTPIHEAVHRSASNREWVNTLIAALTINLLLPYVSPKLLRWGHMQHHRFTNESGKDPDRILTEHAWGPLLLWPFFEVFYLPQYLRANRPAAEVRQVLLQIPCGLAALGVLFWFCGPQLLLFWFVASRLGLWLIVFVFVYLPHHPHDVLQKDDIYGASSLRAGNWLLRILMAGQNDHLVHHLYPTIPFYRMRRAWEARAAFHEAQRPARVSPLGLHPQRD